MEEEQEMLRKGTLERTKVTCDMKTDRLLGVVRMFQHPKNYKLGKRH